jgi:ATP-dependent DNA helicase RecG
MTTEELLALLDQGPGQEIDFKPEKATAKQLAATLVALANADGGTVLIGVEGRSAQVAGLQDQAAARDVALQAALLCEPPLIIPLPQLTSVEGKDLLVITVPPGLPHVYSLHGKYLVRQGDRDAPLTAARLRQLLLERAETSFEAQPAPGATTDDINWDKAGRYAALLSGATVLSPQEALRKRGCLTADGRPTQAGLLLFGQDPQRFLPSAEIIVTRYPGRQMSDSFLREDIRDTLAEEIRRAEAFLVSNMRKGARLTGLERTEQTEYPVEAVREAIVNAVAHRDYSIRGDEIRVSMFADRIEFYSPGRLPGHVTVDNLLEERFSRNEAIVQVLSDLGFIERLGYGIDRMIRLMEEHGLPAPTFQETANGFKVTLYGQQRPLVGEAVDRHRWAQLRLNERQERALEYLAQRGRITNREYQELCPGVSDETIRRDLADLVDKNLLLRIGDKKATYYILK